MHSDKKQGENLYYICCLLETNGPPVDMLVNYTAAAWVSDHRDSS